MRAQVPQTGRTDRRGPKPPPPHVELHRTALGSGEHEIVGLASTGDEVLGQRFGGDTGDEGDGAMAGPGLGWPEVGMTADVDQVSATVTVRRNGSTRLANRSKHRRRGQRANLDLSSWLNCTIGALMPSGPASPVCTRSLT